MRSETGALAFGVAFLGVKDIYSADNSSPQTTEINAKHRAPTLMKWVNIAAVESAALVALLAAASPAGARRWPVLGGLLSLVITYGQYVYAKACGLSSAAPVTESFGAAHATGTGGRPRQRR